MAQATKQVRSEWIVDNILHQWPRIWNRWKEWDLRGLAPGAQIVADVLKVTKEDVVLAVHSEYGQKRVFVLKHGSDFYIWPRPRWEYVS